MHHYRQALLRMRQGDSDREIASARLMGRRTAARLRELGTEHHWLDVAGPLPEDEAIAAALGQPKRASTTVSSLEAHRERIQGLGRARRLGRRHLRRAEARTRLDWQLLGRAPHPGRHPQPDEPPETTCRLDFDARRRRAGGLRRRPHAHAPRRQAAAHLGLRDDAVLPAATSTSSSSGTKRGHLAGLPPPRLRVVRGVPQRVIIDNAKCAITRACAQDPTVQRAYAECAEGYGFKIDPCPPHDPQKKGIVESGVKYVKGNFLALREFRDLADLNAQARAWVMNDAGVRIHGTTRQVPLALFALEHPLMQALPAIAPDLGTWHRVTLHRDCHVKFDYRLYSAPFTLVGKVLWLRATDAAVALYEDYRHVATHGRGLHPGERKTVRDHLPPKAQTFFARDREWLGMQAQLVGTSCAQLIERLLADKILERLRAAQGVISLGKTYGNARLEAACARALAHDSPYYRTVKTILSTGADKTPPAEPFTPAAYANPRFARDAATLFAHPNPQLDLLH